MAFKPIQTPQRGPSERVRNLISRVTLLAVAIVLLYASYRTVTFAYAAHQEAKELQAKSMPPSPSGFRQRVISGAGLPMVIGVGLGALGVLAGLGAVMPQSFFDRFVRPPADVTQRKAAARDYFR